MNTLGFLSSCLGRLCCAFVWVSLAWLIAPAANAACLPSPADLVSWWPFDQNANDLQGLNNGTAEGAPEFVTGEVDQAIRLNGVSNDARVAASESLNVGIGQGMTIEGWFKPQNPFAQRPLIEWNNGSGDTGVHLWVSQSFNGDLFANVIDASGVAHHVFTPSGLVTASDWYHVALSYDRATGVATIYLNGTVVGQQTIGSFAVHTTYPLFFGRRPYSGGSIWFEGLMDEWALYNRALSREELASIVAASSAGRCKVALPPSIVHQPTNQTVIIGTAAAFDVQAIGTSPLTYQWYKNGEARTGATTNNLAIPAAGFGDAGSYHVVVANTGGSVTSVVATLTVSPGPDCVPPAAGLIAWWPFDEDGSDLQGFNNGLTEGEPQFVPGKVGQGILLDGVNDDVRVNSSDALNVGIGNGMTIEGWFKPQNPLAQRPLAEWNNAVNDLGVHLWVSQSFNGDLYANLIDVNGVSHPVFTAAGLITSNDWYHVALTYDRSNGVAAIYLNGNVVGQQTIGSVALRTSYPLFFGRRIVFTGGSIWFQGAMDEWALYNRALKAEDLASIVAAGSTGRCKVPVAPSIVQQPTSQSLIVGESAAFHVEAIGTLPLTYQWYKNGGARADATSATLLLPESTLADAGQYQVVVANDAGSVTSVVATLVVSLLPDCLQSPDGLVAWWPFDRNANDLLGLNNGSAEGDPEFVSGKVSQAIRLDGLNNDVRVPPSQTLNVGAGPGMTIEGWFKPQNPFAQRPLIEWNNGSGETGVHLWVSQSFNGDLFANVIDAGGVSHHVFTNPGLVTSNDWYHVALSYDRSNGVAIIYLNGSVAAQQSIGSFALHTTYSLFFGRRPYPGGNVWFQGAMDEWALYSRALTASEIAGIAHVGAAGKCKNGFPPAILANPQSSVVVQGTTASLQVTAAGSAPLSYQWFFNSSPVDGATSTVLNLTNVRFEQSGPYFVVVSNSVGVATSSVAMLSVKPPPTIVRALSVEGPSTGAISLPLEVLAQGFEHSIAFTLVVDPATLSFENVSLAPGLPEASVLTLNTNNANSGRLGITVMLPDGVALTPTNHALASVTLRAVSVPNQTSVNVSFGNEPVRKEVLDAAAQSLLANFQNAVITLSPTKVQVVSVDTETRGVIEVPIRLTALGIENAVSFSLQFSTSQLTFLEAITPPDADLVLISNLNQLSLGRIGLAVARQPGSPFAAGAHEILRVKFEIGNVAEGSIIPISFGDEPTHRTASDPQTVTLPLATQNGIIRLIRPSPPFEADVSPVPGGDNRVGISDWIQVGRYAAGLDELNPQDFQRADCAPRGTKGNGLITVADWVQAGRYFAGVDPLTSAGGPTEPRAPEAGGAFALATAPERSVVIPGITVLPGQEFMVPVRLTAVGGENALGFSIRFDTTVLTFLDGGKEAEFSSANLFLNTDSVTMGRLGATFGLPPSASLNAGTHDVAFLRFRALPTISGTAVLTFADQPVVRELVDSNAATLSTVFQGGAVTIGGSSDGPVVGLTRSGSSLFLTWPAAASNFWLESTLRISPANWSKTIVLPIKIGDQQVVTLGMTNDLQLFRLRK